MKSLIKRIRNDQRGQTATEYMLIVAVLVTVVIGAAAAFGGNIRNAINSLSGRVTTQMNSSATFSCPAGATSC